MMRKRKNVSRFWTEDTEEWRSFLKEEDFFNYDDFDSLQKFTGTHPAVMKDRIEKMNWKLDLDLTKKRFSFKDALLYRFEKLTGLRPFDFRNYRII